MHVFANEIVLMSAKKRNKYLTTGKNLFGGISPPQLRLLIIVCTGETLYNVLSLANSSSSPQDLAARAALRYMHFHAFLHFLLLFTAL